MLAGDAVTLPVAAQIEGHRAQQIYCQIAKGAVTDIVVGAGQITVGADPVVAQVQTADQPYPITHLQGVLDFQVVTLFLDIQRAGGTERRIGGLQASVPVGKIRITLCRRKGGAHVPVIFQIQLT